jgi:hypothetical protein
MFIFIHFKNSYNDVGKGPYVGVISLFRSV